MLASSASVWADLPRVSENASTSASTEIRSAMPLSCGPCDSMCAPDMPDPPYAVRARILAQARQSVR
jgi:hypothetical protein